MKKELYIGLLAVALLSGCGDDSGDSDGDDNAVSAHNQGISCASCHSQVSNAAEGKWFESGATIYSDTNSSTYVDGYTLKLMLDNNTSVTYTAGRGTGNKNSGLYNAILGNGTYTNFTAKLYDSNGTEVRTSATNSHSSTRLDCNRCHTQAGLNGAPGRIAPIVPVVPVVPVVVATSFTNDVMPLLNTDCKSCHGTNGAFTITTATETHANILALTNGGVNTATPDNSWLLQKASNTTSHGGGVIWAATNSSYITVKAWITEGALNN